MTDNIYEFIQLFNNDNLKINVKDNNIIFKKNNMSYGIKLIQHDGNIIFDKLNNDLDNTHFLKIIQNQSFNNINDIPDLIEFIEKTTFYNYCVICYDKLEFQSDVYVTCGKDECLYKFEELIVGNNVVEKIKNDREMSIFLMESAFDAIKCERKYDIFEPFPIHFLKDKKKTLERGKMSKLSGKDMDKNKDFEKINKIINEFKIKDFLKQIECLKNDQDIANFFGNDLYILIRFILMSCKVGIVNDDMFGLNADKFKVYKIVHPNDKEEEFKNLSKDKPISYLFHGSRWCNWYSILRNGLKNCSGTKLMTAGAAYGNGIYLSDDINLSYGYGLSGKKSIVGVFEILDKKKYHKGGAVYVCDDEKVLIQRYLIIVPSNNKNDFFKDINNMFNKQIHVDKLNAAIKYNKKSIAKIIREYKQLISQDPQQSRFKIDVNPDYPFEWKILLTKFDDKYPIAQDMKKFNIKDIELQVKFPENYPFSPPFIRVVKPRFMHLTAHITGGGSVCNEILTEKGWVPTCSIESLITIIMSEIIEGGGRIDPQKYHIPYSLEEAKKSFEIMAKSHGWA